MRISYKIEGYVSDYHFKGYSDKKYIISGTKSGYRIEFTDSEFPDVYLSAYVDNKRSKGEQATIDVKNSVLSYIFWLNNDFYLFLMRNVDIIKEEDILGYKITSISRVNFFKIILPQMERVWRLKMTK